jgi:acetyl/propionyl-CoA carboxylase alpha subunit
MRPLHAVAAVLAARASRRAASRVLPGIPAGWRNVGPAWQLHELVDADGDHVVVEVANGRGGLVATVDGTAADVVVHDERAGTVDVELDGHRVECRVQQVGERVYVDSALGATAFDVVPRFPLPTREEAAGSLRSPMPGTVIGVHTVVGAEVAAGAVLVTLEAMKMEHVVRAPRDGVVADVRVAAGDQVDAGDVLVLLADEPTS